ncbi:hypothetical protein J6590_064815 [Homalodisca vitripennis]|nr:hypothetical protein J6590_064815 [Homalodisca vitripennis]
MKQAATAHGLTSNPAKCSVLSLVLTTNVGLSKSRKLELPHSPKEKFGVGGRYLPNVPHFQHSGYRSETNSETLIVLKIKSNKYRPQNCTSETDTVSETYIYLSTFTAYLLLKIGTLLITMATSPLGSFSYRPKKFL